MERLMDKCWLHCISSDREHCWAVTCIVQEFSRVEIVIRFHISAQTTGLSIHRANRSCFRQGDLWSDKIIVE